MANEQSSLEIDADFNQLELRVEQRPLLGWAALIHVLNLATFIPAVFADATWAMFFTVPFFLFAAGFFVMGLVWTRPATFRVQATQLMVNAWTGRLARPRVYRLPLDGLSLVHETSGAVIRRSARTMSSLVSPMRSAPKSTPTRWPELSSESAARISRAASRGVTTGLTIPRGRAVVA